MYEPKPLTKEDYLRSARLSVVMLQDQVLMLERAHSATFNMIWNGNLSPQEIMDDFGTEAFKLFRDSAALQTLFAAVIDGYVPLVPPYEFTINQAGTVTIGARK